MIRATRSRPLSVIVPTRDTQALTLRCLASLHAARMPGLEILVVDDASRDGTGAALAHLDLPLEVLSNPSPLGFTAAANAGLERASGDLLLLLNSDTEVATGALEALCDCLARHRDLGALGAQLHNPDGSPQWSGGPEPTLAWLFALATGLPPRLARLRPYRALRPLERPRHRRVDWISGAAMALRREAWEATGLLDEDFAFYCQDLDYCSRLRRRGWSVAIEPRVRVLHHHGATISQDRQTLNGKHLPLLWADLLRWSRKHRRPGWVSAARTALKLGTRLRLSARTLLTPPSSRREAGWKRETAVVRSALRVL